MNTSTEHDRKLAETLKSLSLEPLTGTITSEPPWKIAWRLALASAIFVLITALIAIPVIWPNAMDLMRTALLGQRGADISAPETVAANVRPTRAENTGTSSTREAVFATAREITGSGYVVAPKSTTVFSKYEGKITDIPVEVGDHVDAGQVLVTLDDASARFALEQAMAAKISADLVLSAKDIELAQADASLRRSGALAAREAGSRKNLEEAETAWKSASNAVAQARQDLNRAELAIRIAQEQLDELTVRAPFVGTVTRLGAHVGDTVLARVDSVRENQSLLTLIDTSDMAIDADVAETNIAMIRPGMRGEAVLDGFPDRPFAIELGRIAPVASPEKGTIALRLSLIAPPAGTRPNMAARIRISIPDPQTQSGEVRR